MTRQTNLQPSLEGFSFGSRGFQPSVLKYPRRLLTTLIALALILTTLTPARAQELQKVTLFLGYVENIQFAPIYVAIEKGYFTDRGIDLELEYSFDETDGLTRIATDRLQFGIISGEQVILARAENAPVQSVFQWYQQFPIGLVVPQDSPIREPKDLAGKVVGVPGKFGASYTALRALLASADLTEDDLADVKAIGFDTAPVFCGKQVEASIVYIANEPERIRETCGDVRVIRIADYANLVSNGLITNEKTVNGNADLVRRMTAALTDGLRDVIESPVEETMQISVEYVEGLEADDPVQTLVLTNSIPLWTPAEGVQIGENNLKAWELTEKTLRDIGILENLVDLTNAYTDEYLPVVEK